MTKNTIKNIQKLKYITKINYPPPSNNYHYNQHLSRKKNV